jgi:hypothetical protein
MMWDDATKDVGHSEDQGDFKLKLINQNRHTNHTSGLKSTLKEAQQYGTQRPTAALPRKMFIKFLISLTFWHRNSTFKF